MITQVELTNFQSHRHAILDMGDLTVFTGSSNSGKSSVLRALTALVRNDAVGDYITHGENYLSVKVTLDSGIAVKWTKGKNENSYRISWPDGTESYFQKVGADVPEEVKDVLKLSPVVMEGGQKAQVNIHEQLEAPFLIQDTPGYVAKVFGELTSASKLYTAVSEGNKKINRSRATKKVRKEDLEKLEEQLDDYAQLEQHVDLAEQARAMITAADRITHKIEAITQMTADLAVLASSIWTAGDRIATLQPLVAVDLDPLEHCVRDEEALSRDAAALQRVAGQIKALNALGKTLKELESVPDLDALEQMERQGRDIFLINDQIAVVNERIAENETAIVKLQQGIVVVDKKIEEAYTHLDSCPSCGQELSDEAKETLVSGRQTTVVGGN